MYKSKAYPYPQIVTGEKWDVFENTDADPQPRTDNLNRQMYVPMNRECEHCGINHGRMIRRHELGHAKWSPKTMGKLLRGTRPDCIHVLEEVRINYLLARRANMPIDQPILCMHDIEAMTIRMAKTSSVADIILFLLGSYGFIHDAYTRNASYTDTIFNLFTDAANDTDFSTLRRSEINFAMSVARQFARAMIHHRYGQWPSYRKVQKQAEKLSHIINEFIDKPKPEEVMAPPPSHTAPGTDEDGSGDEDESNSVGGASDLERRMRRELQEELIYRTTNGIGQWGQMDIHNPPLSVNLRSRINNGRAYRPMDYGYNPKYINRFCIDRKIFKQKQRVKGGTILIDASGSMSFSGEDILEIMQMLPAVNIAMYNGYRGSTGDLRIIAKNGMRVNDDYLEKHSGGGNVVDGPALRWLAEMPERRIWVSDMKVFGAGQNSSGYNLLRECYDICTQNKIINLKDIHEVKEHALKLNVV
jgi:hypothetical protein